MVPRFVGSIVTRPLSEKEPYEERKIFQKRRENVSRLHIVATPYHGRRRLGINNDNCKKDLVSITDLPCSALYCGT